MNNQNQNGKAGNSMLKGRGCLVWLGRIGVSIIGLLLVGYLYEPIAEAADAKANPAPGQLVDVGGYRLHINCTGAGSPTVVIESGWGDMSASWGWVQPEIAKSTRVCTYDRAGMGWSEPSPHPRTARQFALELHTLLANANVPGPYVLVGHSLGGYTIQVYTNDYPAEVSGLVLIDSQDLPTSDGSTFSPAPKPGRISLPSLMARIGLARLLAGPLGSIKDLPPQEKQAFKALSVTPQFAQTFFDEGRGMSEGGAQARAVTTLGALPIIVLSRGQDQNAKHTTAQASLLQLSTNSQQIFADQSGHSIMIDQPEVAVEAILQMVQQVRETETR
jgi:pimeloyl-ACP methyl ester carboxylesterase